jgi:20S proteasome alpha/beta subunit
MTTILACAKKGVMVSDSRCTSEGIWFPMTKVHRLDGSLLGIAGNVKEGHAWLKWYTNGKKGARPKLEAFAALILRKGQLFDVSPDGLEMLVERGYHAIGSGGPVALGAFMAGADPKRAVEIACTVDAHSGGDVIVHPLKA